MRKCLLFGALAVLAAGTATVTLGADQPSASADTFRYDRTGVVAHWVNGGTADVLMPACPHEYGGPVLPCRWEPKGQGKSLAVVKTGDRTMFVYDDGTTREE